MSWHRLANGCVGMVILAALLAGCGGTSVIDTEARPIVERVKQADPPTAWTFEYLTLTASPYVACLGGIDEVAGAVDLGQGLVALQPRRSAPELLVTASTMFVPQPTGQLWHEVTLDQPASELAVVFGEVLAGFIVDGIRRPDLNTTALAVVDIASSVSVTKPPFGLRGDAVLIELNKDDYIAELEANADAPLLDADGEVAPSVTVVVDSGGLVSAIMVTVDRGAEGDGYLMTASYAGARTITPPTHSKRVESELDDIDYPSAQESCGLGN